MNNPLPSILPSKDAERKISELMGQVKSIMDAENLQFVAVGGGCSADALLLVSKNVQLENDGHLPGYVPVPEKVRDTIPEIPVSQIYIKGEEDGIEYNPAENTCD